MKKLFIINLLNKGKKQAIPINAIKSYCQIGMTMCSYWMSLARLRRLRNLKAPSFIIQGELKILSKRKKIVDWFYQKETKNE